MSNQTLKSKLKHHKKEQELKNKTFVGFTNYRKRLNEALNEFSTREWAKRKGKRAGKKFKHAAGLVKDAVKLACPPKRESSSSTAYEDQNTRGK